MERSRLAGFATHLIKPIDLQLLKSALQEVRSPLPSEVWSVDYLDEEESWAPPL
jgi:hypothetical protein